MLISPPSVSGPPCDCANRASLSYSCEPLATGDPILSAACGYAARKRAWCTSIFHCTYGYSCISLAQGGVFNSSPPTIVTTSCPLGTRSRVCADGTVTVSAATKFSSVSNAPHSEQDPI